MLWRLGLSIFSRISFTVLRITFGGVIRYGDAVRSFQRRRICKSDSEGSSPPGVQLGIDRWGVLAEPMLRSCVPSSARLVLVATAATRLFVVCSSLI